MLVKKTMWAALAATACVSPAGGLLTVRADGPSPSGVPRFEVNRPAEPALVPLAEPPVLKAAAPQPVAAKPAPTPAPVTPVAAETKGSTEVEAVQERYPNRRIKLERHVILDAKQNFVDHGLWTMWSPDGEMLGTGEFRFGKRHGRWLRWYPEMAELTEEAQEPADDADADDESATALQGDVFVGEEYEGFSRPFVSEANFQEGVLVGEWTILDADGRKINSWPFEKDKLHGKAITFYPDGTKRSAIDFVHGVINGEWIEWDRDGQIVRHERYQTGCHKAPAVEHHANGKKRSEGTLLYAREYADATHDWWNGVIEMDVIENPGPNKRFGLWTYWYENGGVRATGEYIDDRPVGTHNWFFPNGQKQVQGAFVNGQREGTWTFWHENGLRQSQGEFVSGVPVGHWRKWNADGTLRDLRDYAGNSPQFQGMPRPAPAAAQPVRRGPTAANPQSRR